MLHGPGGLRLAGLLTHVISPAPVTAVLVVAVALRTASSPRQALLDALIAVLFGSLLPLGFVVLRILTRRASDVHLRERRQRPLVLLVGLLLVLTGIALLLVVGASRDLIATLVAGLAGIVVCLLVTLRWKISIHLAVLAGAAVIAALALAPWLIAALVLTVPVGWARVRLGEHTTAQVVAGALVGAVLAALVYTVVARA